MSLDMTGDLSGEAIWEIYYPPILYSIDNHLNCANALSKRCTSDSF